MSTEPTYESDNDYNDNKIPEGKCQLGGFLFPVLNDSIPEQHKLENIEIIDGEICAPSYPVNAAERYIRARIFSKTKKFWAECTFHKLNENFTGETFKREKTEKSATDIIKIYGEGIKNCLEYERTRYRACTPPLFIDDKYVVIDEGGFDGFTIYELPSGDRIEPKKEFASSLEMAIAIRKVNDGKDYTYYFYGWIWNPIETYEFVDFSELVDLHKNN
jgi:hypothetical protein